MLPETVKEHFRDPRAVEHYGRAAANLGLWVSEEKIFRQVFQPQQTLLDLGCGAGRIAIGLWELGYRQVMGVDFAPEMVERARYIARLLEYGISFRVGDATALEFDDNLFDGAIFGFNGLMQIPRRERRRKAMAEVCSVVRPGAFFVFTTHDRANRRFRDFWREEERRWAKGSRTRDWRSLETGILRLRSVAPLCTFRRGRRFWRIWMPVDGSIRRIFSVAKSLGSRPRYGTFPTNAASGLRERPGRRRSFPAGRSGTPGCRDKLMATMEMYGIFGGPALAAGIIVLLFPKVFFYLIGFYLVVNAVTAFFHGADPLLTLALILGGVLIFLSPSLVAWFLAFYLLVFAALLFIWGFWFLAIPALVIALIIVLLPKLVPLLIGGLLTLAGGLTLLVVIVR